MENETNNEAPKLKTVKAIPTSAVHAQFDIVELEGKQVVTGVLGFIDQFGMERMVKTGTDKGVLEVGKMILAIFHGMVDITEPDEETKAKYAENLKDEVLKARTEILNAYSQKKETTK